MRTTCLTALLLVAPAALADPAPPAGPATPATPAPAAVEARLVHAPERLDLVLPDGRSFSLLPAMLVAYSPIASKGKSPAPTTVHFEQVQVQAAQAGAWSAQAKASSRWAAYRLVLSGYEGAPQIRVSVRIDTLRPVRVHQEVLRFEAGPMDQAEILDRAYRYRKAVEPVFANALTPHIARLGTGPASLWLLGGIGVQGLWLRPAGQDQAWLEVEADHELNHPFRVFGSCAPKPEAVKPGVHLDETIREAGASALVQFDWLVGEATPLLVERYPRGARAAIVFTDHADQSNRDKLEAFAFGHTGALAAGEVGLGRPGFVNRGLTYTKTIFLKKAGRYAAQFDDPAYRKLLDELVKHGVEIGIHSVSGLRDAMHFTPELLSEFRKVYRGRTWIDHQPDTNCEAITNLGYRPASRWYMLGLLAANGFRFIANAEDVPIRCNSLNLLLPDWSAARRPILYRSVRLFSPRGRRFVQFSSSWLFVRAERFEGWFTDSALDKLQVEQGLMIGHVYFETYGHSKRLGRLSLLEDDGQGGMRLKPVVDRIFVRLAERQARGDLWVTGIEALSNHLLSAMDVRVDYTPDGCALVTGPPDAALQDLSLRIAQPEARVLIEGQEPAGQLRDPDGLTVWFNLPAGASRRVEVRGPDGRLIRLTSPGEIVLEQAKP